VSRASIIAGSSLKAALDLDWDDPEARSEALVTILQILARVELWVEQEADLPDQTIEKAKKIWTSPDLLKHKMWNGEKMATQNSVRE